MKRKFFIPGLAVFMMLGFSVAYLSAVSVYAQDANSYPPLVQRLAERFNLNPQDVQLVFEEERNERHAEMYARFEDRLDELVSDGKLTAEQKQIVLDKHEEMRAAMEDVQNLAPEERREKMQAIHDEFRAWAESEGIELGELMFFKMHGGPGFKGHMMMKELN